MAKKSKRKKRRKASQGKRVFNKVRLSFWLMWCMVSGILFSFGVLEKMNNNGTWMPVIVGGIMIVFAIFTGQYTTETAFAMKMRR